MTTEDSRHQESADLTERLNELSERVEALEAFHATTDQSNHVSSLSPEDESVLSCLVDRIDELVTIEHLRSLYRDEGVSSQHELIERVSRLVTKGYLERFRDDTFRVAVKTVEFAEDDE